MTNTLCRGRVSIEGPPCAAYECNYLLLSLTAVTLPVVARALVALNTDRETPHSWLERLKPEAALLAVALAALTWNKAVNLGLLVWFGGQANMFAHSTLKKEDWKPKENFCVISLFELPPTKFVSGMYRLDTFDGQLNIYHAGWDNYWFSVVRRDLSLRLTTRPGVKWENWNGRTYNVDGHLRLDLLGIANVRFLFHVFGQSFGPLPEFYNVRGHPLGAGPGYVASEFPEADRIDHVG